MKEIIENNLYGIVVPIASYDFEICRHPKQGVKFIVYNGKENIPYKEQVDFPFTIIGEITNDTCDFDCSSFVSWSGRKTPDTDYEELFKDYNNKGKTFYTAIDSFRSLLESVGLYWSNNLVKPTPDYLTFSSPENSQSFIDEMETIYHEKMSEWQSKESNKLRTDQKILIIQKVK